MLIISLVQKICFKYISAQSVCFLWFGFEVESDVCFDFLSLRMKKTVQE